MGVDILLTDTVAPGMSELERAQHARKLVNSRPVAMMSEYRGVIESEEWQLSGAIGCLNKPFIPAELRTVVENEFSSPR